jgi:hypothetical protein
LECPAAQSDREMSNVEQISSLRFASPLMAQKQHKSRSSAKATKSQNSLLNFKINKFVSRENFVHSTSCVVLQLQLQRHVKEKQKIITQGIKLKLFFF